MPPNVAVLIVEVLVWRALPTREIPSVTRMDKMCSAMGTREMEVFVKQEVRVFNWMLFRLMFMGWCLRELFQGLCLLSPGREGRVIVARDG